MALNTQLWLDTFVENLYPSNEFYAGAQDDSRFVKNLSIIIPNYQEEVTVFDMGAAVGTYPRTLKELTHTEKVYSMTQYGVDPYMVDPVEAEEFSYDKRLAVLNQTIYKLQSQIGYKIAWEWTVSATNSIIPTTGTATRLNRFGQTVKRTTYQDLLNLQTKLNSQNVPTQGRRLLVDAFGLEDLQLLALSTNSGMLNEKAFTEGAIMRVAGFDVFMRSDVASFTVGGVKKAIDAVDAATDRSCAVAYHPNLVRYAVGTKENNGIKVFIGQEDPTIYGTSMSAYSRVGASPSYAVNTNTVKGVVTLIEGV